MADRIGACRCPLCGSATAHATLSKKKWVCVTCNTCRCQVFSRGTQSDELLRAGIVGAIPDAPPAEPAPKPAPAVKPAPAPVQPKPEPATTARGWGLLG
jgi:hypothetical protein